MSASKDRIHKTLLLKAIEARACIQYEFLCTSFRKWLVVEKQRSVSASLITIQFVDNVTFAIATTSVALVDSR